MFLGILSFVREIGTLTMCIIWKNGNDSGTLKQHINIFNSASFPHEKHEGIYNKLPPQC